MSKETWVRDISEADFEVQVIERSRSVVVLVDFWAPWCGPCRTLGPHLEKEVVALGGRAELCKLNTDKNPRLAAQFGIRGIPTVKAWRDGKIVDEFTGALPVPALRAFLARVVPSDDARRLAAALEALQSGQRAEGEAALRALLASETMASAAAFHLAHLDLSAPKATLEALAAQVKPNSDEYARLPALENLIAFLARCPEKSVEQTSAHLSANPRDPGALLDHASALLRAGRTAEALDTLLDSTTRNPGYEAGAARRAMLAIFDHLEEPGRNNELAREYRRKLQIVA